jgi:hypothetical protein
MADKSNQEILNEIYDMIDLVRKINDKVRDRAFNSGREDLWRTYEVGHNAQVALAAYVVAVQQASNAFYDSERELGRLDNET